MAWRSRRSSLARAADDTAGKKDAASKKIDPQAESVLRAAAGYLQGLQSFSTDMKSTLDVKVPVGGQQMVGSYSLAIEKPNRSGYSLERRKHGRDSRLQRQGIVYLRAAGQQVPSAEAVPQSLSELTHGPGLMAQMVHSVSFSGLFMLLEPMKSVLDEVDGAEYLGEEKLGEQAVHHLKVVTQATDFQYWIDTGDKPLVRKIVPNMAKALERSGAQLPEGVTLEMAAVFSNWQTDPKLVSEQFEFSPPKGARRSIRYSAPAPTLSVIRCWAKTLPRSSSTIWRASR